MYLCVPLLLWMTTARADRIDSLLTSGVAATIQYSDLSLFLCLLLLFYTVESLHKERSRRMHEIFTSAPVGTGAILCGKALGNCVMAGFVLVAALLVNAAMIVTQPERRDSSGGLRVLALRRGRGRSAFSPRSSSGPR